MKSFTDAIENEIDEVREGAVSEDENEIADIVAQLDALLGALYDGSIDFDATWYDIYDDVWATLDYEGLRSRVTVVFGDELSVTLAIEGVTTFTFERGVDGWYEINNAQERYTIIQESEE